MRIAHIITRLIIGGAQENTVLNCEDLIRDFGDEVLLLTGPAQGPEGSLLDRISGLFNNGTKNSSTGGLPVSSPVDYCDGVIAGTVPHVIIPHLQRAISPWHDFRAWRHTLRILRQFRPDVVHTHSAKAGIIGRYAAHKLGVPVIVHGVHGAPFYPYQNPLLAAFYRKCEQMAAKKCDAFVSVADAMTDLMVKGRVAPREKFVTVYSGMETETFLNCGQYREETRKKYGFLPEHVVIGKVARLFHLKGHEFVIEAARRVIAKNPLVRFLFVGDGILTDKYRLMIDQFGLSDYFTFAGLIPPKEIPAMFSAMDIVVHTSLREGLARVLPQGLLAGKPVISYDIDGAREVVLDGETGYLLPPCEIELLADRMIELAADPVLRERLGARGRTLFSQQFDHHYMTCRIRELYQKILLEK